MTLAQKNAAFTLRGAIALIGFGLVTLVPTCLDPTDGRAEADLKVGHASAGGVRFTVEGGLAAVRDISDGELTLWASAPSLRLHTSSSGATRSWIIELQNAMPDIELDARFIDGSPLKVERLSNELVTRARYRVELPAEGSAELSFRAASDTGTDPFHVAVLSDVQTAIDEVGDLFAVMNQDQRLRFAIGAGDLTQNGTEEELTQFQRELEALRIPYYATLGNHELVADELHWHEYFGRASFSFRFRTAQLTFLDSGSATIDPMVYSWLDSWLEVGRDDFHAVLMHIPPVDPVGVRNGSFASRNEAYKLLGRLREGAVDLTLYGHIHSYYAYDNAGIPAYISGGGGALPEKFDNIGRHFLVVEIQPGPGRLGPVQLVQVDED